MVERFAVCECFLVAVADSPLQYLYLLMKFAALITFITLMYASEVTTRLSVTKISEEIIALIVGIH